MSGPENIISLKELKQNCETCSLAELCLPRGLDHGDMDKLENLVNRCRPLQSGEHLFRAGDRCRAFYTVRSGSFKTYISTAEGEDQVAGFHLPGELVGLGVIRNEIQDCDVVALETSSVCEIILDEFERLCAVLPSLQQHFMKLVSQEISAYQQMLLVLGKMNADERLATFVLSLSDRFKVRGYSEYEFTLSMSRHDVASYLGLAVETVSRLFSRFQEEGLLKVQRRNVRITDMSRLRAMVITHSGKGWVAQADNC